jgi:DNA repair protein RadC
MDSEKSIFKSIKDWRSDERPRERLLRNGASSLSDSELIAILIGNGTKNKSAVDLGRELLEKYNTITDLAKCDLIQFTKISGIGPAKAITLAATFELNKRLKSAPFDELRVMRTPDDITDYYISKYRGIMQEQFRVLLLNSSNQIFKEVLISTGSLNASIVHPREVFREAITNSSASIVLLHNHPSGNPYPSKEDIAITKQLKESGKIIAIEVIDHIIIAGDKYYSFAKNGLLK